MPINNDNINLVGSFDIYMHGKNELHLYLIFGIVIKTLQTRYFRNFGNFGNASPSLSKS